ncbi:guanylate kinase [Morganella psychrotolerans]|uniref:guanylate kinase n=1 Tax=Morganella psychrotolerans TaxID=368603 RepID=UPI0039B00D23
MKKHVENITETPEKEDNRQLLWQKLKHTSPESTEYNYLCDALLAPVISDLKKFSYAEKIDRETLSEILLSYDEYGVRQEFILSRLWQALPESLADSDLNCLISSELNQQISVNNQLAFSQCNFR